MPVCRATSRIGNKGVLVSTLADGLLETVVGLLIWHYAGLNFRGAVASRLARQCNDPDVD